MNRTTVRTVPVLKRANSHMETKRCAHHHQTELFSSLLSTSEDGVHQRVHLRHVDDGPHEPAAEDRRAEQQVLQPAEGEHTVGAKGGGKERILNRVSKKKKIKRTRA